MSKKPKKTQNLTRRLLRHIDAYLDADFFVHNVDKLSQPRIPIVLTEFHLTHQQRPVGLDIFTSFEETRRLLGEGVIWRAFAIIRRVDWLQDSAFRSLLEVCECDDANLRWDISEGRLKILLKGKLFYEPQYMNSALQMPMNML